MGDTERKKGIPRLFLPAAFSFLFHLPSTASAQAGPSESQNSFSSFLFRWPLIATPPLLFLFLLDPYCRSRGVLLAIRDIEIYVPFSLLPPPPSPYSFLFSLVFHRPGNNKTFRNMHGTTRKWSVMVSLSEALQSPVRQGRFLPVPVLLLPPMLLAKQLLFLLPSPI